MEKIEMVRLSLELATELSDVVWKFMAERLPGIDRKTVSDVCIMGTIQATADVALVLGRSQRAEEAGVSRIVANRIRFEGCTEEEVEQFSAKVATLMKRIIKAVYK